MQSKGTDPDYDRQPYCHATYYYSNAYTMSIKRGDLVRAIRAKLDNSLESKASDGRFPPYLFETAGEVVDTRNDYALVMFGHVPTPNIWLRLDQLEAIPK